jgi:hypothetical protein
VADEVKSWGFWVGLEVFWSVFGVENIFLREFGQKSPPLEKAAGGGGESVERGGEFRL